MLWLGYYLLQFHLATDGCKTISIPESFSGVHGFMGKTVSTVQDFVGFGELCDMDIASKSL